MLGASPLVDDLDLVRRIEDAGASAIVMHSLFEEQIEGEHRALGRYDGSSVEAPHFRAERGEFRLGPDAYLEQVRRLRDAVRVPVIASLNGVTDGGWLEYARLIDQAGADALELNVYRLAMQPDLSSERIETETVNILRRVKELCKIPVTVKLSPYYTALAHFVARLLDAGADGIVLFNRFYQPDLDLETLALRSELELSSPSELPLRLRWLAVLSAQTERTLGVSGGVHSALDVLKTIMVGADGVQLVSQVLKHGPRAFSDIRAAMVRWLEAHEYDSLAQIQGSMNLSRCADPAAYERANYLHVLSAGSRAQEWRFAPKA